MLPFTTAPALPATWAPKLNPIMWNWSEFDHAQSENWWNRPSRYQLAERSLLIGNNPSFLPIFLHPNQLQWNCNLLSQGMLYNRMRYEKFVQQIYTAHLPRFLQLFIPSRMITTALLSKPSILHPWTNTLVGLEELKFDEFKLSRSLLIISWGTIGFCLKTQINL